MKLKTINIKGKEYVQVNERIRAFHEMYPKGSIRTVIVNNSDTEVTMQTLVYPDAENKERVFTGIAHEKNSGGMVNATSHYENCETSAVGRALGFLGIGVDTSIATAEEVEHAIEQQEEPKIRAFTYNGKKYPHVTNILSPDPLPIPEWHKSVGTEVDLFMKSYFIKKGYIVPYDKFKGEALENLKECIDAAETWLIDNGEKFKGVELDIQVINHKDLYVGTSDIGSCMYNNMKAIGDFKKSKNIDKKLAEHYFMQMAAYVKGERRDKKPYEPAEIMVICSPFNDPIVSHEIDKHYEMFLGKRAEFKKRFGI